MPERAAVAADETSIGGPNWSGYSARGRERRCNSDALDVTPAGRCRAFVVCDGVGLLAGSAAAARAAAQAAARWTSARSRVRAGDVPDLVRVVSRAAGAAAGNASGATTLACVIVSGRSGILVTVGDSEALAVGPGGPARRLHEIDSVPGNANVLLNWIDGRHVADPHIVELHELPHRLCLVTDGVTKVLAYDRIGDIARKTAPPQAARALVEAARAAGAKDDVTAIVLAAETYNGA